MAQHVSASLQVGRPVAGPVLRVLGMGVALMLATAGPVWAHAFPDHSDPRVGSEVKPSPAQVKIWFDGGIEPLFSSLEVFDANHKKVDKGDSRVDPKDNTVLEVSLPSLPPGTYTVSWSVIALDTHHTEGTFKFSIGR